ncbi:hypothetical protein NST62_12570 [Ureibacillus sp. FSL K6-8385]|uniref:hypothetical protein n=1 Tax=Ureibacillus TaxID=160795 RepID=UPI0015EF55EB|nr:hypothetical protein [Ureibacillus terrenus]MED3662224.1 hypothetical protein [Ureibacillus terrenus]MED3764082.1 hypothetical protein [Ureibacillus terrenus]
MSGKKAAVLLIGIIIVVSILVVIALSIFYAVYEPQINQGIEAFQTIPSGQTI